MTFCKNNNLSQICRALIGCKSPFKFLKGASAKGTGTFHVEHFNHVASSMQIY